jgi:hypothetical protein
MNDVVRDIDPEPGDFGTEAARQIFKKTEW